MGPQGTGTISIGSEAGGVRKSVDGGIAWSADNSGLTNPIVLELVMDASGPQTVYAGTSGGGVTHDRSGERHVSYAPTDTAPSRPRTTANTGPRCQPYAGGSMDACAFPEASMAAVTAKDGREK